MAFTLAEIQHIVDAQKAREARTDFYSARIVAMLVAVNSKNHQYIPKKYMLPLHRKAAAAPDREPMTGEQVMQAFERIGFPVIDLREESVN